MALAEEVSALALHLGSFTYATSIEAELQRAVEDVLRRGGYSFDAQVPLGPRARIDIIVRMPSGNLGLELKTKGSTTSLILQINRYAASEKVDAFLIVTTVARLTAFPGIVGGKCVSAVRLPGAAF